MAHEPIPKNTILAICKMEGPILHAAITDSSGVPVVMTREECFTEGERRLRANEARSFQLWEIVSTFRPQVSIVAVELQ
jgi:hypothetical protein